MHSAPAVMDTSADSTSAQSAPMHSAPAVTAQLSWSPLSSSAQLPQGKSSGRADAKPLSMKIFNYS